MEEENVIAADEGIFALAESTGINAHFNGLRPVETARIRLCPAIRFIVCPASSHLHQALVIHQESPLPLAATIAS